MNPKLPKAVEILIHVVAVIVIVILGVRSYELVNFVVIQGYTISSTSPTQDSSGSESITLRGFSTTPDSAYQDTSVSGSSTIRNSSGDSSIVNLQGVRYSTEAAASNQMIWHIIVYGLYILGWFIAYFIFFVRYRKSLQKKLIALATGWLGLSVIHMSIVVFASFLMKTQPATQPVATVFRFGTYSSMTDSLFGFYFLIVFLAFLAHTTVQFLYRYQELEQADHTQSELALIRSQLRPHFFFNTLNNLYSMALETRNETLADGIQNLTGMMRYSLQHSTKELVPLYEEWEYIRRYVELQKLRINPDSVEIDAETKGRLQSAQVAPMILINFVENAFKHGISYEKNSFVNIKLEVKDELVVLEVRNSNHPSKQDSGTSGIGTAQTKKLLKLYYKDDFSLEIRSTQVEHTVILKLPVR